MSVYISLFIQRIYIILIIYPVKQFQAIYHTEFFGWELLDMVETVRNTFGIK